MRITILLLFLCSTLLLAGCKSFYKEDEFSDKNRLKTHHYVIEIDYQSQTNSTRKLAMALIHRFDGKILFIDAEGRGSQLSSTSAKLIEKGVFNEKGILMKFHDFTYMKHLERLNNVYKMKISINSPLPDNRSQISMVVYEWEGNNWRRVYNPGKAIFPSDEEFKKNSQLLSDDQVAREAEAMILLWLMK